MKAILEFSLPEEKREHLYAVHGVDFLCALHDLDKALRLQVKHNHPNRSADYIQACEDIRGWLREYMDINGVNLEMLE